jgi:hypothetical protein
MVVIVFMIVASLMIVNHDHNMFIVQATRGQDSSQYLNVAHLSALLKIRHL